MCSVTLYGILMFNLAKTDFPIKFLQGFNECEARPKLGNHHISRILVGVAFTGGTVLLLAVPDAPIFSWRHHNRNPIFR